MPRKGSKRRKTRTHVKPTQSSSDPTAPKVPKSFVVKSGVVGNSVSQLTKDLRNVLEPNTASRLRERKSNRLRDYVSMSGPLGVTHLLVFSQPSPSTTIALKQGETAADRAEKSLIEGTTTLNLRLIRLPRGPTLSFKVLRYSLSNDIQRIAKRPRAIGKEFLQAPLLILSGFGGQDKQLQLMTTVFQNLFPPIHVQSMPLSSARRVVLLSYNPVTRTVDFRHYVISIRPIGISKPIRKIIDGSSNNKNVSSGTKRPVSDSEEEVDSEDPDNLGSTTKTNNGKGKGILDLSRAQDISDYILRHENIGFVTSDSEMSDQSDVGSVSGGENSEEDEKKGKVRLPGEYVGRGNRGKGVRGEKRAVRLVELGPRMELGLFKIEEGVGEGEVMFHEMVHKSVTEAAQLAKAHAARRKLAAERRAQQQANVEAKKAAKAKDSTVQFEDDGEKQADEDEEIEEDDKIDSDIEFDYEAEHGLAIPSDEELMGSDTDDEGQEDGDEGQMAIDSDADDSFDDQEGSVIDPQDEEEEEEDDDSDTDPIPISQVDFIDQPPPLARLDRKQKQGASSSASSFKQKGFKKVDRGEAPRAIGIYKGRGPTKKELKRVAEQDKKSGKFGQKDKGGLNDHDDGDDEDGRRGSRGGASAGRGRGRDANRGRGGGSRGSSRGGSSRGRGGR